MATFSQLLLCYFERFNIDRVSDSGVGDCARQSGSGGTGSLLGLFRILHAVEIRYGRGRHTQDVLAITKNQIPLQ